MSVTLSAQQCMWYEFWFAGQRIRESSKSTSKTVAKDAEKNRKRELEEGFNNIVDQRQQRVRTFRDMADEFFDGYKLRLPDSAVFADYAIGHLKRLLGGKMLVDFSEAVVIKYQNDRLDEGAAPKTINEEVRFSAAHPGRVRRHPSCASSQEEDAKAQGSQHNRQGIQREGERAHVAGGCDGPVSAHLPRAYISPKRRDARRRNQEAELGTDQLSQEIPGRWPRQNGRRRRENDSFELRPSFCAD